MAAQNVNDPVKGRIYCSLICFVETPLFWFSGDYVGFLEKRWSKSSLLVFPLIGRDLYDIKHSALVKQPIRELI